MLLLADSSQQAAEPTVLSYFLITVMALAVVLMLYCVFTMHKNPYFTEVQKLLWLLLVLALPIFGPLAWLTRARLEKKDRQKQEPSTTP